MDLTMEGIDKMIIQAKPELLKILGRSNVLNVQLKARLQQVGVITDVLNDRMEPLSLTPMGRVDILLDDLRYGPVSRFLHFCRVMHEDGKPEVLTALNMDIDYIDKRLGPSNIQPSSSFNPTYRPQKHHFYQREESDTKQEICADLLSGLLEHCEVLERTLMRTPLFDFSEDFLLDLTELYVQTDVSVKQNEREQKQIQMGEFFSKQVQTHAPKTLLLEGEVGNGKSSLLRQYAHTFCKQFLECHNKGPDIPCQGHKWRLVVYMAAGPINGSVEEAITENIRCKEQHKVPLMKAISEDGDGILLINDGMDELHNKRSVECIRKYTKECQQGVGKPTMLLSARTGLSQVERVLFDRILVIEGFSLDEGIKYVEKYFKVRYNLIDHPVLKHIKAQAKIIDWVLSNPLLALIFSELTACGALSLEDIMNLSRVKLLRVFEMHIIRRDQERRNAERTEECFLHFYDSCLQCLLKDERKIMEKDIESRSPHMAFLNKRTHTDLYANTEVYFTFGHEMFVEFFAIQGLIHCLKSNSPNKRAMLLYLCANSKMRNSLLLTCGYIAEFEPGLLDDAVFIIQACLVLQSEGQHCVMNELTEGLLQVRGVIQDTFTPDALTEGLTTEQARTAEDIYHRIQQTFSQDAGALRETGWFLNMYSKQIVRDDLMPGPSLNFLMSCINEFTPTQQEGICSLSTHCLLPTHPALPVSKSGGSNYHMFPVTTVRWVLMAATRVLKRSVTIECWCPSDVIPALTQYYEHTRHTPTTLSIYIVRSLWGVPPPEKLTCEEWSPALHHILTHGVQKFTVSSADLHNATPIDGLLTAVQQVVTPAHSLTGGVCVLGGRVSEEVLVGLSEWAWSLKFKMKLQVMDVLLDADRDHDYVMRLNQRVQCVMDRYLTPTYVLPNGHSIKCT